MASSDTPSWLLSVERRIEEEKDDDFGDAVPHEIVRDLLLATDEDGTAIDRAVQQFESHYVAGFALEDEDEDMPKRQPPEYNAGRFLNAMAHAVFDVMDALSFEDSKHDKLANFVVALKDKASTEFDRSSPRFVYYGWGLDEAAGDGVGWQTDGLTKDTDDSTVAEKASRWANASALVAKLYQSGLLDRYGPIWVARDFAWAFEKSESGDISTNVGRQAQVLVPANHILLAGEAFLRSFQNPVKDVSVERNKAKWGLWAGKLQEIADAASEDAPWGLKGRAQKAHDKMVDLWPEAFQAE